jgi:predicted phage terminase large subunit-like protein
MNSAELKGEYFKWRQHSDRVQRMTTVPANEPSAVRKKRIQNLLSDYGAFVEYYFPHFCTDAHTGKMIPSAPFHIEAANYLKRNLTCQSVFQWARGHAKSTHMTIFIPLWLKAQGTVKNMVLVGKSEDSALRLLANLQAELENNERYKQDFGQQSKFGNWSVGEFVTTDECHFIALGRGQSPRGLNYKGRRPDYIVVDDLDDDELCRNESRVARLTEWVKEALFGTFGAEGGRFVMVGNLIAKNSVLAAISKTKGVHVTRVNIWDKSGKNPSWKDFWTVERIEERRRFMGYRAFEKEYMNNPITDGAVFMQRNIIFKEMLPLSAYRSMVCYTDPSFKNSATADYKATVLAARTSTGEFHVLKTFAAQCSVSEMVDWHYRIMNFVQGRAPVMYYMEANFMQDLMLDEFRKAGNLAGMHIPVIGDKRQKGDKFARIEAMQPLFERNLVIFNKNEQNAQGMEVLIEQLLAFERGSRAHDDAPDALESAIWMLSRSGRITANKWISQSRPSRKW